MKMPGSSVSVAQSVASTAAVGAVGKLTHVHYVPIYNAHRLRRRQREILEQNLKAIQELKAVDLVGRNSLRSRRRRRNWKDYKPIQSARRRQLENLLQTQTFDIPSTYTGARYPLLPKTERDKPKISAPRESNISQAAHSSIPPSLTRVMSHTVRSQSPTRSREISGALKLPQLMRSFIPTEGRKLPPRPHPDSRSTWIDLTGSRNMKQVMAPSRHKAFEFAKLTAKPINALPVLQEQNSLATLSMQTFTRQAFQDIGVKPVSLVTVDYDKNVPKLHRRPLPPIHNSTPQTNARKSKPARIWHPMDSQSKIGDVRGNQAQQHNRSSVTKSPNTDAGKKLLENLVVKVDETRKKIIPPIRTTRLLPEAQNHGQESHWENGRMRAQKSVRKRNESDRYFGNFRSGVILNKLPSDLVGNYKATFENLNYYLGKGAIKIREEKQQEEGVIIIPTGRQGETPEYEIDEDAINPEFLRSLAHNCDVKMRYAHRSSSDTPSMERMPWEENESGSDEAEMAARNAALASMRKSGSRKVKRLTVKLPDVPYLKQERLRAPPATPVEVPDTMQSGEDQCEACIQQHVTTGGQSALGIPLKISRKDFGAELLSGGAQSQGGKQWYGVRPLVTDEVRILRGEMKTIQEESKKDLTEQLILAHGAMKKRNHSCSQKEILITPFTVKIDEKSSQSSVELPSSRKPLRSDFRSNITKPYTFSYISANKKRASQSRDPIVTNQLCNSPEKKPQTKPDDSWYIRNFVRVTPDDVKGNDANPDVINPPNTAEGEMSTLDKATDPIVTSQTGDQSKLKGKKRRRVKLTHPQNAPIVQPIAASET